MRASLVCYNGAKPRMIPMRTATDVQDQSAVYASDVQDAIHGVMRKYAKSVGFESQLAIIGVAIGAILHQLAPHDREYYTRLVMENIEDAPKLSQVMHYH